MIIWALAILILVSVVIDTIRYGISPMPSPVACKKLLKKQWPLIGKGKIYDLGSGWGGMLKLLNRAYPKHSIIGIEGALIPYLSSRIFSRTKKVKIFKKNFHLSSFEDAALVYCYLYPGAMEKLSDQLKKELPKGGYVISAVFAMPRWEPIKVFYLNDLLKSKLYIYQA